jgi:archaellum component FlaF (FlaF/FlaG flagellin family)
MGYSTLIAFVVLFTFFLVALSVLYGAFHGYLDEVSTESVFQSKRLKEQLHTEMAFTSTTYHDSIVELYVENTGSQALTNDSIDLYVDQDWIQQSDVEYEILNTTIDPLLWNQDEFLLVNASVTLSGGLHEAKIVVENGVYASVQFTV